jgi:hypothetical protein
MMNQLAPIIYAEYCKSSLIQVNETEKLTVKIKADY